MHNTTHPDAPVLYIDTISQTQTVVALKRDGNVQDRHVQTMRPHSQNLLPLIAAVLKKNNITYADLGGIEVHTGPGSFTGTRVGCTVANALAWGLSLPVNHQQPPVLPVYARSKFDQ